MLTRRILGCLLLAAACSLAFSQIYALLNKPEFKFLPDIPHDVVVKSNIETFGFAIPATVIGCFLLRDGTEFWLWCALAVTGAGLWLFVIHELWLHYFELPRRSAHYAAIHPPYFSGPLWCVLTKLAWHILFPAAFILTAILLIRRAPESQQATTS